MNKLIVALVVSAPLLLSSNLTVASVNTVSFAQGNSVISSSLTGSYNNLPAVGTNYAYWVHHRCNRWHCGHHRYYHRHYYW
ncbi:MAG: hypothetical protein ACHP65_00670 [Legionellales bacterium]